MDENEVKVSADEETTDETAAMPPAHVDGHTSTGDEADVAKPEEDEEAAPAEEEAAA